MMKGQVCVPGMLILTARILKTKDIETLVMFFEFIHWG